jgi:hypothetical protein
VFLINTSQARTRWQAQYVNNPDGIAKAGCFFSRLMQATSLFGSFFEELDKHDSSYLIL